MYVSDGVLRKRRPCGLWLIPALMWSIFNLIVLFFRVMMIEINKNLYI